MSLTFSVVMDLAKQVPSDERWHHIFCDNLYGNVTLAENLLQENFEFTSTMRSNRLPKQLSLPSHAQRGSIVALHHSQSGVSVCIWKDRKDVKFLTSAASHRPISHVTIERRGVHYQENGNLSRSIHNIEVLNVSKDYNDNMNGVDVADQIRGNYSCRIKSNKWWSCFFFFCLDTCICNAYLAYKTYHTKKQTDPKLILDHHAFRATLAQELSPVPSNKKRKHINTYPSLTNINHFNNEANHFPEKVGKSANDNYKSRKCAHCKSGKSIYVCPTCQVGLHVECFKPYHTPQ